MASPLPPESTRQYVDLLPNISEAAPMVTSGPGKSIGRCKKRATKNSMDESIAFRTEVFDIGGNNRVCVCVCVSESDLQASCFIGF